MVNLSRTLAALLIGAGSMSAAIIITEPTGSVGFSINGVSQNIGLPSILGGGRNTFTLPAAVTLGSLAKLNSLTFSTFDDPFVTFGMAVQNTSSSVETFTFTISNPYIGGPYTILHDSFSDSFTDAAVGSLGDKTVTIGLASGATSIAQPFIDAMNRDGQGVGCTKTSANAGFSSSCNPASDVLTPVTTNAVGLFGVTVSFTLSPGDIYTFNGEADLQAVPEPATFASMGLASLALLCVGHRLRRKV